MSEEVQQPNPVITVPIGTADRSKTSFAFIRNPMKMAEIAISLIYEKKIEAPAVIMLTGTEMLIVGVAGLMQDINLYEERLRAIAVENKAWACIQAVYAVLKSGDDPVMHLRVEADALDGLKTYGVVIFGWGQKKGGGVAVMAHPEKDYDLGTPFILRPKLVVHQIPGG